jgi:CBS domain containing-hemolysin-like protein
LIPLVKVIRVFFYPIAAPLAWCLDRALGRELLRTYSSAEMLKMLQIHVQENMIDQETAGAMVGAMTYKKIAVKEVMTPIEKVFMLNVDEKLSFETMAKIFRSGYSRIPVYEISPVRYNVVRNVCLCALLFRALCSAIILYYMWIKRSKRNWNLTFLPSFRTM